jgi:hypothetical protein
MRTKVQRRTVDLSAYPDLVVIYLGMRVNALAGLKTLFGFGPKIAQSVAAKPDGLLLHENLLFSLFPPHLGMRQYWRDFDALESWARSEPHRVWWKRFTMTWSMTPASCALRLSSMRKAACSRHEAAPAGSRPDCRTRRSKCTTCS